MTWPVTNRREMILLVAKMGTCSTRLSPLGPPKTLLRLKVGVVVDTSTQNGSSFDQSYLQAGVAEDIGSNSSTRSAADHANVK
jgi:hypothetical protein